MNWVKRLLIRFYACVIQRLVLLESPVQYEVSHSITLRTTKARSINQKLSGNLKVQQGVRNTRTQLRCASR